MLAAVDRSAAKLAEQARPGKLVTREQVDRRAPLPVLITWFACAGLFTTCAFANAMIVPGMIGLLMIAIPTLGLIFGAAVGPRLPERGDLDR